MNTEIRKLSVGKDFPDGAIHYQVGKIIRLQDTPYIVHSIEVNTYYKEVGKIAYDVFLANEGGSVLWKTVCDVPVIVENNINFD